MKTVTEIEKRMFEFLKKANESDDILDYKGVPVFFDEKPISSRQKKIDQDVISFAENQPKEFLRGVKVPYRGYINEPRYRWLVKKVMEKIIDETPHLYFEWDLDKQTVLRIGWTDEPHNWLLEAGKELLEKNPLDFFYKGLFDRNEYIAIGLHTKLFDRIVRIGKEKNLFGNRTFDDMLRKLSGTISRSDVDYYWENVFATPYTSKVHDNRGMSLLMNRGREDVVNMGRQKIEKDPLSFVEKKLFFHDAFKDVELLKEAFLKARAYLLKNKNVENIFEINSNMNRLAAILAKSDPEFYWIEIYGREYSNRQSDREVLKALESEIVSNEDKIKQVK